MPELPEIEHLRRTLQPWLVGARVRSVNLLRRDVVRIAGSRRALRGVKPAHLLEGDRIVELKRRGKSLAIIGGGGRVLVTHMGMSGSLEIDDDTPPAARNGSAAAANAHVHCEWVMDVAVRRSRRRSFRLLFRDPRRFGGLWPFESMDDLLTRPGGWARLGPDALEPAIDSGLLRERLLRTSQPMKAALLNQALVAGVGNIYADESLFAAGIHPLLRPRRVSEDQWRRLAAAIRSIMLAAVGSGGSTIRSYRDPTGKAGTFVFQHRVYGRAGQPCLQCGQPLQSRVVGQRTTVYCEHCQKRSKRRRSP